MLNLIIGSIFVSNYVLVQFLGICPSIGVSNKLSTSVGMGIAVTFVTTIASVVVKLIYDLLLVPYDLVYLRTIVFILVIASLVQFVEMFMKKSIPSLYDALGVYLPLITTNCMVLGVALLNIDKGYTMAETIVNSLSASVGFTIALVLLSAIREKYEIKNIPESFKGVPIAMLSLGLMAIAFMGFNGLTF